ncbi:MAG: LPS translocon maturation chaperone LptM [Gammaproteobacteria bacterium]
MHYKFFASLLMLFLLLGCGQKGPLYLPDETPPIHVEKEEQQ